MEKLTLEQIRDRFLLWLLAEELPGPRLACVETVARLYVRRIAGDEPTIKEWREARSDAEADADARARAADAAAMADANAAYAARAAHAVAKEGSRERCAAKLSELLGGHLPTVPAMHRKLSRRVNEMNFNMAFWHCGTTHCRAGHAVDMCAAKGYAIEKAFGSALAGGAIYWKNTGMLPDFYASTDVALADIRRCAREEEQS